MSLAAIVTIGLIVIGLLSLLVYITVREIRKRDAPMIPFDEQLDHARVDRRHPLKVLLAIDGSPCSIDAIAELAACPLPRRSEIEVVTAIHSRLPFVPDPSFSAAAAYSEVILEQERVAPALLQSAAAELQRHHRHVEIATLTLEGPAAQVILDEAARWGADRIILGSHGHGAIGRAVMGSTATRVVKEATCSVYIVRPHKAQERRAAETARVAV
jgi:nucleotide-binding universal stress UspA family protein